MSILILYYNNNNNNNNNKYIYIYREKKFDIFIIVEIIIALNQIKFNYGTGRIHTKTTSFQ